MLLNLFCKVIFFLFSDKIILSRAVKRLVVVVVFLLTTTMFIIASIYENGSSLFLKPSGKVLNFTDVALTLHDDENENNNGRRILGELQGTDDVSNTSVGINISIEISKKELLKALANLIQEQKDSLETQPSGANTGSDQRASLLTLFTTVGPGAASKPILPRTLKNWAKFKPLFIPVLFTDDAESRALALKEGWEVLNVSHSASCGLPVIHSMFKDVMHSFNSKYYGYANSDILFTENFIHTLVAMDYSDLEKNETFITGRRVNVVGLSDEEVLNFSNISQSGRNRGTLFQISAEDYFITGKGYKWDSGPDVVVGALGIDNWLVFDARASGNKVIDGTESITAVHQSLENTGNYQSHRSKASQCNFEILQKYLKGMSPPYPKGFTECINLFTVIDDGQVVLKERTIPDHCKI